VNCIKSVPVRIAGYCYENSGVIEEFEKEGWPVEGCKALNDVVGFYGLTDMRGHAVVAGCGSFSQVIYVNAANDICWPGDDVTAEMPPWLLSGRDYASFLLDLSKKTGDGELSWLSKAVRKTLGSETPESSGHSWSYLGPLIEKLIGYKELYKFITQAVENIVKTENVFRRYIKNTGSPVVVLGGGAVKDEKLWELISIDLQKQGLENIIRVKGEPAVGLARYAACYTNADAWTYIGNKRPSWL
jgi:hypothetical protein